MIERKSGEPREKIKEAWAAGDLIGLLQAGFDNFLSIVFDRPLPFQTFLDYTSSFIDRFIIETEQQEHLRCAGGKLFLELGSAQMIQMTADLYFQDRQKKWILKKKEGCVAASRFSDWDKAPEFDQLRCTKKLEFPITAPVVEVQ